MIELPAAAVVVAVVHSLSPDHYLPFAAIGNARGWGVAKMLAFAGIAVTTAGVAALLLDLVARLRRVGA